MGKNGDGEGIVKEGKDGRREARYHDTNGNRRSVYGKTGKGVAGRKLAAKIANKEIEPVRTVEQNDVVERDFFAEYLAAAKDTIKVWDILPGPLSLLCGSNEGSDGGFGQ